MHIGCIQVAFKPLTLQGLNASILAFLRDGRCIDFIPSLMGIIQTSLCQGPVYFDIYPNLTLSLNDRNFFDPITLKIQTQGYNYLPGSSTISVTYRIYYKVMNTLCPNAILRSDPGKTVVIDSNCLTTNVAVPRLIKWEEIDFPKEWLLPNAVPPAALVQPQIDQIVQNTDGDVEVSFVPGQRLALTRSISSSRDYGRPYNVSYPPSSRHSTSSIDLEQIHTLHREKPNPLEGFRMSEHQIPHGIYRPEQHKETQENDPEYIHGQSQHQPFPQGFPPKKDGEGTLYA